MFNSPFGWPAFIHCPPPPMMFMPSGEDNDVFIKNTTINPPGNVGPPGPPGPQGPQGSPGVSPTLKPATADTLGVIKVGECLEITPDGVLSVSCCKCNHNTILINENYTIKDSDWYIGVTSNKPVEILLIEDLKDGFQLIVKLEMGPPIGNRKVTIKAAGDQTIDGVSFKTLQEPYESITLVYRGGDWHVV